jgi:hypothetical protein
MQTLIGKYFVQKIIDGSIEIGDDLHPSLILEVGARRVFPFK